jgi:DNA-binding winged helix-turn-helix (wHTH) protein/class 3 adenylate cyclase/predicted ATPase
MLYRFADCELDSERFTLRRAGKAVTLQRRVFKVLVYLLEHRGQVVSKDELAEQVWQSAIANTTIETCVKELRKAVGDSGQAQRIIATRHRFGYEFVADVVVQPREAVHQAGPPGLALPAASPVPEPLPDVVDMDTASAARSQLPSLPHTHPGETKVATVLCCGLQTAPGAPAGGDLDRLSSQMRTFYRLVGQYGGTIQPVTGNRFLALFGAPLAQEDHAQRAMLAALRLLSPSRTAPQTPAAEALVGRLGLYTGEVAVGGFGEGQELTAAVMGETALLATVLQDAAAPGTVLCSATTARLVQGMVDLEPLPPLILAAGASPVQVYKVVPQGLQHVNAAPLRRRPLRQFVGRRQELAMLRRCFEQAAAGHGQVVGIVGESGIGKSRLLDEFRKRLAQHPVTYLEGRCLSYSQDTPYRPILDILRHACGLNELDHPQAIERQVTRYLQELGMVSEDSAPYLLHLLGVPAGTERLPRLTPEELKTRIYGTFRHLARQASQQHPLVIAIEDLHWIDATSEALLTSLVEYIAGVPILLLGTYRAGYRPPWLDKSYATQFALQPLTFRDGRRLLQAVFSTTDVPEALIQRLLEQAEGNPFFLEELAWTVLEHGASSPSVEVPDTVQAVLMARMDRLPPAEKHLLQVAAVIGKDAPLSLLEEVAELPLEAVQRGFAHLQSVEFLYESRLVPVPIYTFKHALTREVAYHSLLRSTRQPYHQRIAQALVEQFPETARLYPELLAHHYTEAGLAEQAIPYWQQAGQRALERSANHEAISHFTKGLELLKGLPKTPERVQQELTLQLAIGSPLLMLKGHTAPEVEHAYTRAYELAQQLGEIPQRFSVLVGLWRFYFNQAKLRTARELAEQCFALAQHLCEPASLQEAHTNLGSTFFFMGDLVAAHAHLEQGIALYDPQQSRALAFSRGTDPGVVNLARSAWTLWWLGYPDRALARSRESIALAHRLSHPGSLYFALHYNALLHVWCREMALAKELLEAAIVFMQEYGFVQFLGGATTKLGCVLIEQGDIEKGLAKIHQGLEALRIHKVELARHTDLAILAQAYGRTKQAKEGLRVLGEAFDIAHNNAEGFYEAELYRLKGELLLQSVAEDVEEVEACFHQAIILARHQSAKSLELRAVMSLSRLWQRQGKQAAARQMLAELYSWFTEGFDTPDLQEAKALLETLQ